jgi:hypothetical protein
VQAGELKAAKDENRACPCLLLFDAVIKLLPSAVKDEYFWDASPQKVKALRTFDALGTIRTTTPPDVLSITVVITSISQFAS